MVYALLEYTNLKQVLLCILTLIIIFYYCKSNRLEYFASTCPDGGCVGGMSTSLGQVMSSAGPCNGDHQCETKKTRLNAGLVKDKDSTLERADEAANDEMGGADALKASPGEPLWHFSNYRPYSNCPDCTGLADENIGEYTDPNEVPASGAWNNKAKRVAAANSGYITSVDSSDHEGRKNDFAPSNNWLAENCLKDPDCLGMVVNRAEGSARMLKTIKPLEREDPEEAGGETSEDVANFHDTYILHPYRALKWQIEHKLGESGKNKNDAPWRARIRKLMTMGDNQANRADYPRHDDWAEHDSENVLEQLKRSQEIGREKDIDGDGKISEAEIYAWELKQEKDTDGSGIVDATEEEAWKLKNADVNADGVVDGGEQALWEKKLALMKMRAEGYTQRARRRGGGGGGRGGGLSESCKLDLTDECVKNYGSAADVRTSHNDRVNRRRNMLSAGEKKRARAIITMLTKERTKYDLNGAAAGVLQKHKEIQIHEKEEPKRLQAKNAAISAQTHAQNAFNAAASILTNKNRQKTNMTNYYNEAINKINYWKTNKTNNVNAHNWHHAVANAWIHYNGQTVLNHRGNYKPKRNNKNLATWGVNYSRHYHSHYTNVMRAWIDTPNGEYQTALNGLKAVNQTWGEGEHIYINGTNGGKGWNKRENSKTTCRNARNAPAYHGFHNLINHGHITGKTINDLLECRVQKDMTPGKGFNRFKYKLIRKDGVIRRELSRVWRDKLKVLGKQPKTTEECGPNQRKNRKAKCGDCYQDKTTRYCTNIGAVGPAPGQYWRITYWQNIVADWLRRYNNAVTHYNYHINMRNHYGTLAAQAQNKINEWSQKATNRVPGMQAANAAASHAHTVYHQKHSALVTANNNKTGAVQAYNNAAATLAALKRQKATFTGAYNSQKSKVDSIDANIRKELADAGFTEEEKKQIWTPPAPQKQKKSWSGKGCHPSTRWYDTNSGAESSAIAACTSAHGATVLAIQGYECRNNPSGRQTKNGGSKKMYEACPVPV